MKILCIFGTRPEVIKMAPVIRALQSPAVRHRAQTVTCLTGQHREMLDPLLALFAIRPDYNLDIMQDNQSLSQVTVNVLNGLEKILAAEKPVWVLVQGDTTTAMAGALAAFYQHARSGHIEAGLRTGRLAQPFPEEANRKIVDLLSDLHLAPTETARANLLREGIADDRIRVTGNTVIDTLHWVAALPFDPAQLGQFALDTKRRLILVTAHRRENFGAPLENICAALREIAERYAGDVQIVYPVHMNPNIHATVHRLLGNLPNVTLVPPLDYLPLVQLMKRAYLILTDSGGIQEEAPALGKPVLVLREITERPEAVQAGTVKIVGTDCATIVRETMRLLDNRVEYDKMARAINPYGDGYAAERIVEALLD